MEKAGLINGLTPIYVNDAAIEGSYVEKNGEMYYEIKNFDKMDPFFISIVSDSDLWMYASSTGALTAGRVNPQISLFPYETVDKVNRASSFTGPVTIIKVYKEDQLYLWEPFNNHVNRVYDIDRKISKNILGNKLLFSENNKTLGLTCSYEWCLSDKYGFIRKSEIINVSTTEIELEILDGLQNILPFGVSKEVQQSTSCLVDAYKWAELDKKSKLGIFCLYAQIWDRAEPKESLKATKVWVSGIDYQSILLSSNQINNFKNNIPIKEENLIRGIPNSYLTVFKVRLKRNEVKQWKLIADVNQSQSQISQTIHDIIHDTEILRKIEKSISLGSMNLQKIMGATDGLQKGGDTSTTVHHYANVLFNNMRGGLFIDGYKIPVRDVIDFVSIRNKECTEAIVGLFNKDENWIDFSAFIHQMDSSGNPQLSRLAREYLPIFFSRRHGDPSRPWNKFSIEIKDEHGNPKLNYQGNWRDIFQNWEALAYSYPLYLESMISIFVNASTIDGYNPYRVTREGIEWEEIEPDDAWSYIGYWGDHQIIYLLKLLEAHHSFFPGQLEGLLTREIFSYANVPYDIKLHKDILKDPKNTIDYNHEKDGRIKEMVHVLGTDAKLVLDKKDKVYQVSLAEKLLVSWLAKLSNLVVDGGIWLNTQRPEWNDANNALVGYGTSMVTLYYLRRFTIFLQDWLSNAEEIEYKVSAEVAEWYKQVITVFEKNQDLVGESISSVKRREIIDKLGMAASDYRQLVYKNGFSGKVNMNSKDILKLSEVSLGFLHKSIDANRSPSGLFHAYNLLDVSREGSAVIRNLYDMLEGQVSLLSAGYLSPEEVVKLLDSLFESPMYRDDQHSFMLYPDRTLPHFLEKNVIPSDNIEKLRVFSLALENGLTSFIQKDIDGNLRFNAQFSNADDLSQYLDTLSKDPDWQEITKSEKQDILDVYESVFDHQAFTGRSGTMFGYEGLGSIYWHMVSKLLLAIQECFWQARESEANTKTVNSLATYYYKVRRGLSFNKSPEEYGSFPMDPYSHTPGHSGAQQPGMTGQVKEEILTRLGELGIRISNGSISVDPSLLRNKEFLTEATQYVYFDVNQDENIVDLPIGSLGFTYCQVPVIYHLSEKKPGIELTIAEEELYLDGLQIGKEFSQSIFAREGRVKSIRVYLQRENIAKF